MREIYEKIVREDPPPPRSLKPKTSVDLETIILKSLNKAPRRRYPTARAFADDLRRYLNHEPIEARPPSTPARLWRTAVKHRRVVIPVAAAILGAMGGAWAILRLEPRSAVVRLPPLAPGQPELGEDYEREWTRAVPLLPLLDPEKDSLKGEWKWENGKLVCGSRAFTKIQIPFRPPEEYDLLVVCVRKEGIGDVDLLLNHRRRQFLWAMGANGNAIFGFGTINGTWADSNPTTRHESNCLVNGHPYSVIVQVRKEGVWAYVNGKLKSGWRTDYLDMGTDTNWGLPDSTKIGLGTYESPTEFRRVDLLEVTGKGRMER